MFLRIFKHLLPNARAWRLTVEKQLREFFDGLTIPLGDNTKLFFDNIWLDIFPETTREITAWEKQFGLRDTGINEQERRDRLAATWQYLGGQDPRFIQDNLQANGFDVYVHQWWIPGTEASIGIKSCATPRSPLAVLRREFTNIDLLVECGEANIECGEAFAECGNRLEPSGYPLVNKILQTIPDLFTLCDEAFAECGEIEASCGNYSTFRNSFVEYIVPNDSSKWPYFIYIGDETFGDLAPIDPKRKNEFETLCLKICPTQQWLGILVEYI